MKLSKILKELSRRSQTMPSSMLLHECSDEAARLEEQDIYEDVHEFHVKFEHPAPASPNDTPTDKQMDLRISLIQEEAAELCEAIRARDLAQIAAEAVDLIYVTVGTLVELGLPLLPFWHAVHRANMAKKTNPTGGKTLKPKGWKKPNVREVLYEYKRTLNIDDPDGPEMG